MSQSMKRHSEEFERAERVSGNRFGDVLECDRYFVICTHKVDNWKGGLFCEETRQNHEYVVVDAD